ncbi:hypothetical protein DICPUDRAFT_148280 [Dictyostelium purpureum]|uniref:NADPH--cytochrome P450 reductase n=1 Tax=Dictyostelium purpureum TaxID=5786 RepID=F0ZAP9_DICPU|nr:uncharacterized protein DICPUDRAFT_148280 [Dictyostelium purpureum]EGC38958.1 hypothetical protein DICPUDRAFT_148280 [Dictyostelium purpureum]|eukprot:XP_003284523.1 hypothetical protein DICPUDRAFT_148280 [Dictyostelium purpureum]
MEMVLEYVDLIESLIIDNLGAIIIVVVIVGTYLYMNKPPPPPPIPQNKKAPIKPQRTESNKGGKKENKEKEKVMKIFFGTQTRTAEDFSRIIEKESKKIGIPCEVVDLESYDVEDLANEWFVMFLVSTHGEGDPTDNAKEFYLWLTNDERPTDLLTGVPFTVFGLGNKTYEHYNAVARVIDRRMEELGAKRAFERGEGDDDATLEEDFNHWKKRMWPVICPFLGYELKATDEDKFVPRFRMVTLDSENKDITNPFLKVVPTISKPKTSVDGKTIYDIKNPYYATITENRELHSSESDRSCRHIEFALGGAVTYQTGDHLGIYPINDGELVEKLIQRLGVNGEEIISLIPADQEGNIIKASFGPMSIRKALSEHFDITNPPRKSVLRTLSEYTTDEQEKKKLLRLASEEASEEYNQFIKHDFRSIGELLDNFPNLKPNIAHFLEFIPRLPARYYSISSSPNHKKDTVSITSVVVNFTTPTSRFHNGVASTWLSNLKVGDKVPLFVRESHFRLPSNTNKPVIMVGPGTGLAPFRGFLQEMQHKSVNSSESLLFFGCRSDTIDYLYKEELEQYKSTGVIGDLIVAFSRKTNEKVYVQNKIMEHKHKVWDLIHNKGAHFYICGDARNMAKSVQQSLVSLIKELGSKDDNSAQQYIEDMESVKKIINISSIVGFYSRQCGFSIYSSTKFAVEAITEGLQEDVIHVSSILPGYF